MTCFTATWLQGFWLKRMPLSVYYRVVKSFIFEHFTIKLSDMIKTVKQTLETPKAFTLTTSQLITSKAHLKSRVKVKVWIHWYLSHKFTFISSWFNEDLNLILKQKRPKVTGRISLDRRAQTLYAWIKLILQPCYDSFPHWTVHTWIPLCDVYPLCSSALACQLNLRYDHKVNAEKTDKYVDVCKVFAEQTTYFPKALVPWQNESWAC